MRKVLLKISNILFSIFLVTLIALSLSAFVLTLIGKSIPSFDFVDYVYLLYGFIFVPIEYLICGTVGQMSADAFSIIIFIISAVIIIMSIILIIYKFKSTKEDEYRRKYYKTVSYILIILAIIIFAFNYCILLFNYLKINYYLSPIVEVLAKNDMGGQLITIYNSIIMDGIATLLFSFIVALCYKKPAPKAVKIYGTINFYSNEYEEPKNEVSAKIEQEKENEEVSLGIKESSEEAKDLVLKIMQLEELRKSGQINDVEYTKLRQKAIKRYKR